MTDSLNKFAPNIPDPGWRLRTADRHGLQSMRQGDIPGLNLRPRAQDGYLRVEIGNSAAQLGEAMGKGKASAMAPGRPAAAARADRTNPPATADRQRKPRSVSGTGGVFTRLFNQAPHPERAIAISLTHSDSVAGLLPSPGSISVFFYDWGGIVNRLIYRIIWWSQAGSNRRPQHCQCCALPAELWPLKRAQILWALVYHVKRLFFITAHSLASPARPRPA